MLNTLFLESVPDERQNVACAGSVTESVRTPFTPSSLLSESLEQAKKTLPVFLGLKRFILREPDIAQRVYVLITGGREFKSRRKDSLGT